MIFDNRERPCSTTTAAGPWEPSYRKQVSERVFLEQREYPDYCTEVATVRAEEFLFSKQLLVFATLATLQRLSEMSSRREGLIKSCSLCSFHIQE